ncbi:MAG TPA: TIGR03435 family protein [Acidobacteriaceae bacterium]
MRFQSLLIATALTASTALAQSTGATPVKPMAADAHPSFAVAAIKPHDPNSRHQGFDAKGDRVTARDQSVTGMMMFAYGIHPRQIAGAPGWVSDDRWDVEGTSDTPGEPNLRQQQEMLQKLLADRFGLHFNREKRELAVYAIQVAKGGPKLKPAANPDAEADQDGSGHGTEFSLRFTSVSLPEFAMGMQFFVHDRPVVDQTGIAGRYDLTLRYTFDEAKSTDPNAPPGLFTAVQEQLGLKLDAVKAPADVFVIDHVERPSAN